MLVSPVDTLVFDLDNTLIDRNKAMRQTVERWLAQQSDHGRIPGTIDDRNRQELIDIIMEKDDWGYADRNDFAAWILSHVPGGFAGQFTVASLQSWFWEQIPSYIAPNQVVIEFLENLAKRYRILLATNGGGNTQRAKLRQASLLDLFNPQDIFISGETGAAKPDPLYYSRLIERSLVDPARSLFIGDHPVHDIAGAATAGFRTCWVSYNRPLPPDSKPDLVITYTTELIKWL